MRKFKNRQIWLIAERGFDARDNGFVLYKYIRNNYPDFPVYYLLTKDSSDLKMFDESDNIVFRNSVMHFICLLTANRLISTHVEGYSTLLFQTLNRFGLFRLKAKSVFLQHGVTKDMIPFLKYPIFKTDLFVTGALPEFKYINQLFGHPKNVVQYLGFPRFDNLHINNKNRYILFMPTWRNYFFRKKKDEIYQSSYYKSIQLFLNSNELNNFLKQNNLQLYFYPHVEIFNIGLDFSSDNDLVKILDYSKYRIQDLLLNASLLITDYSSVFMDFAYMRKPVIYYHFDYDLYRATQYQEGYFDYKSDGFGPVLYESDNIIEELRNLSLTDFEVNSQYKSRIDSFFPLYDSSNSERVFNAIMNI